MAGPRPPRDCHPATKQSFADLGVTKEELDHEGSLEYSYMPFTHVFARIPTDLLLCAHYAHEATVMHPQPRDIPTFLSDIKLLTNTQICR